VQLEIQQSVPPEGIKKKSTGLHAVTKHVILNSTQFNLFSAECFCDSVWSQFSYVPYYLSTPVNVQPCDFEQIGKTVILGVFIEPSSSCALHFSTHDNKDMEECISSLC